MRAWVLAVGLLACDPPGPIDAIDGSWPSRGVGGERPDRLRPYGAGVCLIEGASSSGIGDSSRVTVVDAQGQPLYASWWYPDGTRDQRVWERDRGRGGMVVEVTGYSANGSTSSSFEVWERGRLVALEDGEHRPTYQWGFDAVGRLVWTNTPTGEQDTYTYDGAGHLSAHHRTGGAPSGTTRTWTWEGERLVSQTYRSEWSSTTTWLEHDGDLPTRGETPGHDYDYQPVVRVEVWTWADGLPTSYGHGAGEPARTWTWDGDRLVEARSGGTLEVWTWDDADRPVALERSSSLSAERWTWSWDGARLTEHSYEDLDAGTWGRTTWTGSCPTEAWWRDRPRPEAMRPWSAPVEVAYTGW